MTQDELRRKCEDEAREILKCKVCEGHGWNIGIALGRNGEPEQTQVQCDKCYRGEIASYGDDLIKAITEALLKMEMEIEAERNGKFELRNKFGAKDSETFEAFVERLYQENARLVRENEEYKNVSEKLDNLQNRLREENASLKQENAKMKKERDELKRKVEEARLLQVATDARAENALELRANDNKFWQGEYKKLKALLSDMAGCLEEAVNKRQNWLKETDFEDEWDGKEEFLDKWKACLSKFRKEINGK